MKKNFLLLFLLISFTYSYSQNNTSKLTKDNKSSNTIKQELQILDEYKSSNFNYFLNSDWQGGSIFLEDNTALPGYAYRYNVYTDQIEVKTTVNPSKVEFISIGGKIFIYSSYINNHETQSEGYFELLVKDDCKLLLKRNIKKTEGNNSTRVLGTTLESTSVIESYYIKKTDQPAVLIHKKKHSLLENLSDKQLFVDYINDKFIPIINEKKLIELVNYYNKL